MIQRREHLCFALETLHAGGIFGELRRQHFDRDATIQLGVGGAIHSAHATLAELGDDAVVRNLKGRRHGSLRFSSSRKFTRNVTCRFVLGPDTSAATDAAKLLPLGAISTGYATLFRRIA